MKDKNQSGKVTTTISVKAGSQPAPHIEFDIELSPFPPEWLASLKDLLHATAVAAVDEGLLSARRNMHSMINASLSGFPAPRFNMREAQMIAKAQERVIQSTQWVTSSDIAELGQFQSTNKSAAASKWKTSHKIFSVKYMVDELYPIYALDKNNGYRPIEGLKPIIELFAGKKDGWGMAYWFAGVNGFLGGARPQDLLQTDPDRVLQAAENELTGITHG